MKTFLGILMVTLALAACSNKKESPKDSIEITSGSAAQTIYADQTSVNNGQGITFKTSGPWYSEIREISRTATQLDWISLSQTSGDAAGEYTIQIALGLNNSGKDRKAEIRIICGQSVITVSVEQKGTTENGKIIRLVRNIDFTPNYWSEAKFRNETREMYEFKYDLSGRVTEYIIHNYEPDNTLYVSLTTTLDYNTRGEIHVTETEQYNDNPDVSKENYTLTLNDKGQVTHVKLNEGEVTDYDLSYTDDRLARIDWQDYDPCHNLYTYSNGVLSSITEYNGELRGESFKNLETIFGKTANNLQNIDPNAFFLITDAKDHNHLNDSRQQFMGRLDRMALLRLIGKNSDFLIEKNNSFSPDLTFPSKGYFGKPGSFTQDSQVFESLQLEPDIIYTFDNEGYILTITQQETVIKKQITWDVYITDQFYNGKDDSEGYIGERVPGPYTSQELGRGINTYVYTFRYE